jgi:rubrerythrin
MPLSILQGPGSLLPKLFLAESFFYPTRVTTSFFCHFQHLLSCTRIVRNVRNSIVKEIITWLREIEHQAIEMYLKAASLYQNDHNLKKFLEHTAEDESWHYHVMGSASVFLESEPDIIPAVSVDEEIKNKITKQIKDINNGLDHKTIPREELIDKIVELELSEWNDLFLYAVNFLKERTTEFKYPAARIQAHIKEIEYFLETVEGRPQALLKIKALPPVWIENILVVDDEEMITKLINSLLNQ